MILRYKKRLLEHLNHREYTPQTRERLAEDLGFENAGEFADALDQLAAEGLVEVGKGGLVQLPSLATLGGEVVGRFRRSAKGHGFVEPRRQVREGLLFIPPADTLDALTGDTVRAEVRRDRARERQLGDGEPQFAGRIVEVVERKRARFSGAIDRRGGQWLVYPDGRELDQPVVVRDAEAKNVKPGDKVVIEMTVYPEGSLLGEGVIVKVLGESGRPDVETMAVISAYGLPMDFPEECVEQAREISGDFDVAMERFQREGPGALRGRRDLTGEFILTIDPPDAKDYDDAISIRRTEEGWELGVHIADVGEFIEPGTPLDEEARKRGNSVYLPRLVIPMLPEVLSNGICSLQEGVLRNCKSALMRYDRKGNIVREGCASTLIKSAKRLTYLEAQALIDGNMEEARRHAKTEPNYTPELQAALREMNLLARAIQERRRAQGMISLELPEAVLVYDEHGHVVDAEREDDAFTHTLIEMFMVEANEVLARLFENLDVPLIRRTHADPMPGDVDRMRTVARVAGYTVPRNPTREELQALLDATRGTPAARAVHMAVLRTLSKAEYSPLLIGHFALASTAYAHFTSPIRRYADLTVHRALVEYLRRTDNGQRRPQSEEEKRRLGRELKETPACPPVETLLEVCRHITRTEELAEEAERALKEFLILQLLSKHIGETYRGVITNVSPRGVYVQLDKFLIDGLIKAADLPGDVTRTSRPPAWKIDPRSGGLMDIHSGRSFNFGDTVTVKVAQVDLSRRQMDLVLEDAASRAVGKAKKPPPPPNLGGGMAHGQGAGFKELTGAQRRSAKSKRRDKGKPDWRRERK